MITRILSEHGANDSLFGRTKRGQLRRALREGGQDTSDEARDHVVKAIAAAHKEGNHDLGNALAAHLEEWDESLDDESQGGRGKPAKDKGEENTPNDDKGKESMESRQHRNRGRGLSVLEARDARRAGKVKEWSNRLLRG